MYHMGVVKALLEHGRLPKVRRPLRVALTWPSRGPHVALMRTSPGDLRHLGRLHRRRLPHDAHRRRAALPRLRRTHLHLLRGALVPAAPRAGAAPAALGPCPKPAPAPPPAQPPPAQPPPSSRTPSHPAASPATLAGRALPAGGCPRAL
eukprot:4533708-Prymnesium_polylepis.1